MTTFCSMAMNPVSEQLVREVHFAAGNAVATVVRKQKLQQESLTDVVALTKGSTISISFWPMAEDLDSTRDELKRRLSKWGPVNIDSYPDVVKDRVLKITFVDPNSVVTNINEGRSGISVMTAVWILSAVILLVAAFFMIPSQKKIDVLNYLSPGSGDKAAGLFRWVIRLVRSS